MESMLHVTRVLTFRAQNLFALSRKLHFPPAESYHDQTDSTTVIIFMIAMGRKAEARAIKS